MGKNVWIDLENSPHVMFFLPWISWLRGQGHTVLLTARDLSQTHQLLDLHHLEYTPIGNHMAGGKVGKALLSLKRGAGLVRWAQGRRLDLALGHGSRAQALAAAWLGVPSLTFVDYEFVSLQLFGLCCRQVFVPDAVSPTVLRKRGIPPHKLVSYPGVKELVYLDPERDRIEPVDRPLIVVRPPASQAHYHADLSETLYRRLLERLGLEAGGTRVVLLPRYRVDIPGLKELAATHPHFHVPEGAIDGPELLRQASLVVSGGGTMVREAAVLNVPAASYFGGPLGGVDRSLVEMGRLILLRTEADVNALAIPNGSPRRPATIGTSARRLPPCQVTRDFLTAQVESWLRNGRKAQA